MRHSAEMVVPKWRQPIVLSAQTSQHPKGERRNSRAQTVALKWQHPKVLLRSVWDTHDGNHQFPFMVNTS